jgi:DTW domain-containing protein YfiP
VSATETTTPRALCTRCLRPPKVCVCALLPRLAPRTKVLILQHPKEHRVAIGTARMAARALEGSRVVVGVELDGRPEVEAALADPAAPAILLMPGPGSRDLATDPPTGPVTLVTVDGTWHHAKKLLKLNPRIASLPRYGIDPEAPSAYRIRREPSRECLSTIEALAQALGRLEGDPAAYRRLLVPFHAMVDAQIREHRASRAPRSKERLATKRRLPWRVPPLLADPARVLLVSVECNAWPLDAPGRSPDEVVALFGVRGDGTGATELLLEPTGRLAPSFTYHTGIHVERVHAGQPREALADFFAAHVDADTTVAFWGSYALQMLRAQGLGLGRGPCDLRGVASRWLRTAPGSIEHCAAQVGGAPTPLGVGRGGARLGLALHVFRALQGPRPD